ncbi:hypothetical protein [Algoriphagus namhaensis]
MNTKFEPRMTKRILPIYFLLLGLLAPSCTEEEDKTIRTDLPTEAQQFFKVSQLNYEHLFLALKSWAEFKNLESSSLPGCPEITLEESNKQVTLTYRKSEGCESAQNRSGKLILDLALQSSPQATWFLEFEDYTYAGDTLKGFKTFKRQNNSTYLESFESLLVISANQTSFELNADLTHQFGSGLGQINQLISTTGTLTGRNPAGRAFDLVFESPSVLARICNFQEQQLPISGTEIYQVQRGNDNSRTYRLLYESTGSCETTAKATLPDGRNLILSP